MRWFLSIFAPMTLSGVTPAAAASLTAVLGDSLSDPCNLWTLDPDAVPNPPCTDRQQTNGDTSATKLGNNCAFGLNFAYAGATAVDGNPNPVRGRDTIPSSGTTPTPNVPDPKLNQRLLFPVQSASLLDSAFAAQWIMTPIARAMDALVINVSHRPSRVKDLLRGVSQRRSDFVTWEVI